MPDVPKVCTYLKKRFPNLFVFEQPWTKKIQTHRPWLDEMYDTLKEAEQDDSSAHVILIDGFGKVSLELIMETYMFGMKNFPVRPKDKISTLIVVKHRDVDGDVDDYINLLNVAFGKDVDVEEIEIDEFLIEVFTF